MKKIWDSGISFKGLKNYKEDLDKIKLYMDFCGQDDAELSKRLADIRSVILTTSSNNVKTFPINDEDAALIRSNQLIDQYNKNLYEKNRRPEDGMTVPAFEHLGILNDYRNMLGVKSLVLNLKLAKAAYKHSVKMFEHKKMWHVGVDGNPGDRAKAEGYEMKGIGENVAQGCKTAQEAFDTWYYLPGHHRNMVRKELECVGVGETGRYWTQLFGVGEFPEQLSSVN
ncbi:MAG: CAP domain-containing protein [Planctomycetes bacterium]|nr:CAP domain-containing protein [Planctomycetota bacterium]